MANQLMFYENPVAVSSQRHRETCISPPGDFGFARNVNSVPLVAAEFAEAGAEFPIVFVGQGDSVVPTVILGATGSQNAFVSEDGAWTARFMPFFIGRYPFVFSEATDQNRMILFVDEAAKSVNTDGRGERLFDVDGNQTQYLNGVLRVLEDYQQKFRRTQQFCDRLVSLDLLRPMEASFTLDGQEPRKLTGFKTVDREKLKNLDEQTLMAMLQTDELECVFLHLASLRHFGTVADKSSRAVADSHSEPDAMENAAEAEPKT